MYFFHPHPSLKPALVPEGNMPGGAREHMGCLLWWLPCRVASLPWIPICPFSKSYWIYHPANPQQYEKTISPSIPSRKGYGPLSLVLSNKTANSSLVKHRNQHLPSLSTVSAISYIALYLSLLVSLIVVAYVVVSKILGFRWGGQAAPRCISA